MSESLSGLDTVKTFVYAALWAKPDIEIIKRRVGSQAAIPVLRRGKSSGLQGDLVSPSTKRLIFRFGAKHRRCCFSSLQSFQSRIPGQMADRDRCDFVERPQPHCVYNLGLSTWYGGRPQRLFRTRRALHVSVCQRNRLLEY